MKYNILWVFVFSFWANLSIASLPIAGLTDLDGNTASLDTTKKKQLVMFWATWCGSCRHKLKNILPKINEREDVSVFTINIDKDIKRAKHYVAKYAIDLPVFRDEKEEILKALNVTNAPHWAVYEKDNLSWKLIDSEVAFNEEKITALLK